MCVFFNDTATTEIYTLSLHDALPIFCTFCHGPAERGTSVHCATCLALYHEDCHRQHGRCAVLGCQERRVLRSEEHTSELQSRQYLVCRLLLEKKNVKATPLYTRVSHV